MKKHAKMISMIAVVALFAVVFTAAVSAVTPDEATPDEIGANPVSLPVPDIDSVLPPEELQPELDGGILSDDDLNVTASAHAYREEKLLLVTVENSNESVDYSIDVKVSYLGVDGEVIGTETQSFDQLASEFSRNFIFQPGYDFADYRIETEKTVYTGECWKTCITDVHVINEGYLQIKFYNNRDTETIATNFKMVIFDENGEVFDVQHKSAMVFAERNSYRANGVGGEDCSYVGCEGGHPYDHDEYEKCGRGRLNAFVTHEVVLPETHPDYDEWMKYANLPGNVLGED